MNGIPELRGRTRPIETLFHVHLPPNVLLVGFAMTRERIDTPGREVVVHALGEPDRAALRARPVARRADLARQPDLGRLRRRRARRASSTRPSTRTSPSRARRWGASSAPGRLPAVPAARAGGVPGQEDGRRSDRADGRPRAQPAGRSPRPAPSASALAGELAGGASELADERAQAGGTAGRRRRRRGLHGRGADRRAGGERASWRRRRSTELRASLREELEGLLSAELELEGDVPLVLLPVRVEVRSTADGSALRVRIFHDALHAETLDEGLSEAERDGRASPTGRRSGRAATPTAAWPALVAAVGAAAGALGRRGAAAAEPRSAARRAAAVPADAAAAPPRPAVARTLPDRFFVRVEQDGVAPRHRPRQARSPTSCPSGSPSRDELTALSSTTPTCRRSTSRCAGWSTTRRPSASGWRSPCRCRRRGRPVRRLLVYGVRAALDPRAGAERLERLIRSHRFTDGAEFVAQGTPTNNTDSARTEWSRRTPPRPTRARPRSRASSAAPTPPSTATALGLDPALLATLPAGPRRRAGARRRLQHGAVDDDLGRRDRAPDARRARERRQAARQPVARCGPRSLGRARARPRAAAGAAARPPALRSAADRRDRRVVAAAAAAASSRAGWCRSSISRSAGCGTRPSRRCRR